MYVVAIIKFLHKTCYLKRLSLLLSPLAFGGDTVVTILLNPPYLSDLVGYMNSYYTRYVKHIYSNS